MSRVVIVTLSTRSLKCLMIPWGRKLQCYARRLTWLTEI